MVSSSATPPPNRSNTSGKGTSPIGETPARIRALNRILPRGFGRWRLDSADALEASARKASGSNAELTPHSRIALAELLRSYKATARLHPLGEIMTAVNLLALLQTQLGVNAAIAARPSIATRPIVAPLVVTGLPRTGSTLLHNLLALDPQLRAPQSWEVSYPTPLSTTKTDRQRKIRKTQRLFGLIEALHPGFRAIHELDAQLPQECLVIMASALRSHLFFSSTFVPDYQDWLDEQPQRLAYEQHKKTLQLLQDSDTPATWALKAPSHLFSIDGLLATYPDCNIVYTRRSPASVVASIASLQWHLYRTFSNFTDTRELGRQVCMRWGAAQSAFDARLSASSDLQNRTSVIDYENFVQDPIETVRALYQGLNLVLSDNTATIMQTYLKDRPQHRFGTHSYQLADYGLTPAAVDDAFQHRSQTN